MGAVKISELDSISSVTLSDKIIIEQTVGAVTTTYQGTVSDLLGILTPTPTIVNMIWDSGNGELEVEGTNLLPTSLVSIEGKYYLATKFDPSGTNPKITVYVGTLSTGSYTVEVENLIHSATDTLDVA